jgi:hypothetical protein
MGNHVKTFAVTSAAYVPITAQTFARYAEIAEDGTGSAAGLIVEFPDGSVGQWLPGQEPIKFQNPGGGAGGFVGTPAQPGANFAVVIPVPASVYCQVKSAGAATVVRLFEVN